MKRMRLRPLLITLFSAVFACTAPGSTLLILQFHNTSQYSDLNWVGESIAQTLTSELGAADQIVLDRDTRNEGLRRLTLRPDAGYTKATIIRLGQSLDADLVCYGSYEINLPSPSAELKDSSVRITGRFLDLRKMRDGPEMSEAGKLADLTRLEEHLAWQTIRYVDPSQNLALDKFLSPVKLIRLDAEESYIRGLMSSNPEQKQKWLFQATKLDPQFVDASFELGRVQLSQNNYRQAVYTLQRIPSTDVRYSEARFYMGLASFRSGEYAAANGYFHEVAKQFPLSEIYNNIGAAENQLNQIAAIDDFRRALEGDQNDPTYLFNLSLALVKNSQFEEAADKLRAVVSQAPHDAEAQALLKKAVQHELLATGNKPPERLKNSFNETAFKQLKAALVHPKD
jgi:tetratricopeptide (TPR) repeat protein